MPQCGTRGFRARDSRWAIPPRNRAPSGPAQKQIHILLQAPRPAGQVRATRTGSGGPAMPGGHLLRCRSSTMAPHRARRGALHLPARLSRQNVKPCLRRPLARISHKVSQRGGADGRGYKADLAHFSRRDRGPRRRTRQCTSRNPTERNAVDRSGCAAAVEILREMRVSSWEDTTDFKAMSAPEKVAT